MFCEYYVQEIVNYLLDREIFLWLQIIYPGVFTEKFIKEMNGIYKPSVNHRKHCPNDLCYQRAALRYISKYYS